MLGWTLQGMSYCSVDALKRDVQGFNQLWHVLFIEEERATSVVLFCPNFYVY